MKTTLTFPMILALALPMALPAQAQNKPNSPAGAGRDRQAIINKLESIRLDTVRYDGLPLSEVVINLREEAKKRDPEKKGINFLLNPNLDPGVAASTAPPTVGPDGNPVPAPPAEQVDLGTVCIKINPPLSDIRLVDVLDAVVKVADHPIKYSVEDYGVVFSPRGAGPERNEATSFLFPGGTPSEFLNSVQEQYKVDWSSVADIPKEMADAHIPRLRISQAYSVAATGLSREEFESESLKQLVSLYNQLGQQKPELGSLVVQGGFKKPSVVMFVPDKALIDARPKVKVKAFSIYGMNEVNRAKLEQDIDLAKEEAMKYASRQPGSSDLRSLEGIVAIHDKTGLLVATGPESFVDMVESIVAAWQHGDRPRNPVPPTDLPTAPGK